MDIAAIARKEMAFNASLKELRAGRPDIKWYPYDSLGSFTELQRILTGERRYLLDLLPRRLVLDLGTGDGDVAFFLASLACQVDAVDFGPSNYNGLTGALAMRELLKATSVTVHEMDLDDRFTLPRPDYDLALAFGVLYHIKNPFYLLEHLAQSCRYLLLSTRVAALDARTKTSLRDMPVAYLVDELETNADPTNYWIFSQKGLRTILARARWEICNFATVGRQHDSDPGAPDRDERAYCFARSLLHDRIASSTSLDYGWYELEQGRWRWTARNFRATITRPPVEEASELRIQLYIPKELLDQSDSVVMSASINGVPLRDAMYDAPGPYLYRAAVPRSPTAGSAVVECSLSHALTSFGADERELGVIVHSLEMS
jgi:tRNA (mo5U34)-methyltransferase